MSARLVDRDVLVQKLALEVEQRATRLASVSREAALAVLRALAARLDQSAAPPPPLWRKETRAERRARERSVPCTECGAGIGEWCVGPNGRATQVHSEGGRRRPAKGGRPWN